MTPSYVASCLESKLIDSLRNAHTAMCILSIVRCLLLTNEWYDENKGYVRALALKLGQYFCQQNVCKLQTVITKKAQFHLLFFFASHFSRVLVFKALVPLFHFMMFFFRLWSREESALWYNQHIKKLFVEEPFPCFHCPYFFLLLNVSTPALKLVFK